MFVGTQPQYMKIQFHDPEQKQLKFEVSSDQGTLGDTGVENGWVVYVIDQDPQNTVRSLQDTSQVEKYEMSDEKYNARETTYRKWKDNNAPVSEKATPSDAPPTGIEVGNRCEVDSLGGGLKRRGTVKYIGTVTGSTGHWVGVQLDEPMGKNDGTAKGVRYFECPDKYGLFVKPDKITVGDFPEMSFDDEI
eukprot:TRINITY_DN19804_c0_g1_i1.p1 TRINITY_DN19804_c0_g1~~TRINITY_DN19804_c0_g1_i1.p1  ORF type:complete len:191 (+),score=61.49 TRINITY_DN19804_c0_g1_i1:321-893(+)